MPEAAIQAVEDWSPDYTSIYRWRIQKLRELEKPAMVSAALVYYSSRPAEFIEHWIDTYDPRATPKRMPFILFPKQREMLDFLMAMIDEQENGLIEKSRDMGASWLCCAFSVWLFLFRPASAVGWGSRKEQLVDKIGDPSSIFEKMRMILERLPSVFLPKSSTMSYLKLVNEDTGSTITGEAGDNIGRGGRTSIYFKDEAAHYERPEKIEAALGDNTNVQIDISSVHGLGNVFHRRREAGVEWAGDVVEGRVHVFIMDWSDHPKKDQNWYNKRKARAESEGLLHIFKQEVDRDYAASIEGVLIPADWVKSAIDAHIKLGFTDDGGYCAGLDVADGGQDSNVQALRKGVVLRQIDEWSERDTGATARKSVGLLEGKTVPVQYDCIGVGAGVKAETNRLREDGLMPKSLTYYAWNAAAGVLNPDELVVPNTEDGYKNNDRDESPTNKDFYTNLKAQAGWNLRLRFERTHKAVTEGVVYDSEELISIDSQLPLLRKLQKELSQATAGKGSKMKLLIEKTPDGTKSPNLADAVAMCYWPVDTETVELKRIDPQSLGINI